MYKNITINANINTPNVSWYVNNSSSGLMLGQSPFSNTQLIKLLSGLGV